MVLFDVDLYNISINFRSAGMPWKESCYPQGRVLLITPSRLVGQANTYGRQDESLVR